jgi:hypothetical protein
MDPKKIIELRKEAEKVVADMPDGDLKLKAFEVILIHLLSGIKTYPAQQESETRAVTDTSDADFAADSVAGRVLVLKEEGFFKNPKSIGEIREELSIHGWRYPLTTLSGRLINLVQKRKLRRTREKVGKKTVYKYSNH